jgi:histidine triad (HIT) family protein
MRDCVFCKIVAGELPAQIVYRDELATVFRDIHPAAPVHLLVTPNRHIASLNELGEADEALAGRLMHIAAKAAAQEGLSASGYRVIVNTGPDGGQVVFHLHLHVLGGRRMRHPLG